MSTDELIIAINMIEVSNCPEAFERMRTAGPKMCNLTASYPGFLGYQAQIQSGALPLAGRYGGAALHMMQTLNPLPIWQYTVWENEDAHSDFHRSAFARAFEICAHCFPVLVEGPWEMTYRVVASNLPAIRSPAQIAAFPSETGVPMPYAPPQRSVAIAENLVKAGQEAAFERNVKALMAEIAKAPGFLGYMLMRYMDLNPWGSLMLDPISTLELGQTFGANPPFAPEPRFEPEQTRIGPAPYLLHTEWETPELAAAGLDRATLDRRARELLIQGLEHVMAGPYVKLFTPMMEQAGWRETLITDEQ
ncbi:sulfur oxygenase reductase family protein [Paraliomyxa miuraensis]|uniref:sulfur oxygenase reductase family protein n=1 Tax=Paraliomyxa miuraensis TaxID=376150 RepID=UPI00225B32C5|nr:sulfur oxygenase reductase family protein [Paraliomyxa miuraensis]MCX4243174.1 sulfur oxygenase reductase family protein [Paraliomyxa miuraensis]